MFFGTICIQSFLCYPVIQKTITSAAIHTVISQLEKLVSVFVCVWLGHLVHARQARPDQHWSLGYAQMFFCFVCVTAFLITSFLYRSDQYRG